MKIVDIQEMPNYNSAVKNGVDSVSTGKVSLSLFQYAPGAWYPTCVRHGAMLKVSRDGIWRCGEVHCSHGCYEIKE